MIPNQHGIGNEIFQKDSDYPKSKIAIRNGVYSFRGQEIPLYSGEWSYWAVIRGNWRAVAKRVKEMGLQIVSSYIPWSHHELSPGDYDWEGSTSPQRDLIGFIELCREEGLYLILRPGPYIYAGWPQGGPPERVGGFKLDRLSPQFLAEARRYIEAICRDVLAPRQITRGGNIIIVQADNEPYPSIEKHGDALGCFRNPGLFTEWLKSKYGGDLERLNRRWKTAFQTFDEACVYFHEAYVDTSRPMAERLLPTSEYRMRYADTHEFIGWYAAEVVRVTRDWMRESGIDVPVSANSWSPLYADFGKFCEVVDIAGMDIYPSPNFAETLSLTEHRPYPVKDNWFYNVDILKLTEANVTGGNVWCGEFQSGVFPMSQCGYFPPGHFHFITLALMARGLKVWNWYMLVTQYNWPGAPINEWGWPNEYYPVMKETLDLVRLIEPWNLAPMNDVGLVVYKPHRVIDPGNFEAVFNALESANVSYAYVDPQSTALIAHPVLVYAGADWLAADDLGRLEAHVENGGTLVTFNQAPFHDEFGNPSRLPLAPPEGARPVLLPVAVSYRGGGVQVRNAGHIGCKVNFCYFRETDGEPLTVSLSGDANEALALLGVSGAVADTGRFVMGCAKPYGKGRVIFIGSNPSPDILRMVLTEEGQAPYASVDEPLVTTACFRHRDGSLLLFVVNRNSYHCRIPVRLNTERLGMCGFLEVARLSADQQAEGKTNHYAGPEVPVSINACDVTVMRIVAKG